MAFTFLLTGSLERALTERRDLLLIFILDGYVSASRRDAENRVSVVSDRATSAGIEIVEPRSEANSHANNRNISPGSLKSTGNVVVIANCRA
jgi:hypothetical protein